MSWLLLPILKKHPVQNRIFPRYATFGLFVPLAMLCYGLQQGFKRQVEKFASKYYMMDTLKLDGVTIGRCGEKASSKCLYKYIYIIYIYNNERRRVVLCLASPSRLQTASHLPWNIKPVLGMLSDGFPLFGFHRTS